MLAHIAPATPVIAAMSERRGAKRRRVLKGALIIFNDGKSRFSCTLRDISETGARLLVGQSFNLPARFDLLVEIDGMEAPCEIVRRQMGEIGVRFCSPPCHAAPVRPQVLGESNRARPAASLRRKRVQ